MVPGVTVVAEQQVPMRPDLLEVFELSELEKYYTDAELTEHPERKG
jgi:succinate dehydrogenase / fumarate reductase flavoprotein subunit